MCNKILTFVSSMTAHRIRVFRMAILKVSRVSCSYVRDII
jgi:hypothetical protein